MNRAQRVLAFLEQHPNTWIGAVIFEPIGGRQAWRTAISEARKLARADGRDIVNRARRMNNGDVGWVLSEYKLTCPVPADLLTVAETTRTAS